VRHFHGKVAEEPGVQISYTWVKMALQGAGLVNKHRQRGTHRRRRQPRPLPGMCYTSMPASNAWFGDGWHYDLITILDDATSEIYYARIRPNSTGDLRLQPRAKAARLRTRDASIWTENGAMLISRR
jgi:hypothetical protein